MARFMDQYKAAADARREGREVSGRNVFFMGETFGAYLIKAGQDPAFVEGIVQRFRDMAGERGYTG